MLIIAMNKNDFTLVNVLKFLNFALSVLKLNNSYQDWN